MGGVHPWGWEAVKEVRERQESGATCPVRGGRVQGWDQESSSALDKASWRDASEVAGCMNVETRNAGQGWGLPKKEIKRKEGETRASLQLSLEKASVQKQRQGRGAAESLVGDQPRSGLQTRALGLARQTRDWMSPLHSPISALHPIKPTMPS